MAEAFTPGPETQRAFRDALGRFATGVTLVTAPGPFGIVANSFASVSLDPPLVLWCPAKSSNRGRAMTEAAAFAIHVLAADQRAISDAFIREGGAFDACKWAETSAGVPLVDGCAARFECQREAVHDAGDHWIIVGRVTGCALSDAAPLLFHSGRYAALAPGP